VAVSFLWFRIASHHDGLNAMFFLCIIAPAFGVADALLAIIPSAILYFREERALDRKSLWLSVSSFLLVASETVILFMLPLHGC
jgi:hypothetical protein